MPITADLDFLFQHFHDTCNDEPIKDLLQRLKQDQPSSGIAIGKSKEDHVANLRKAVVNGHCDLSRIHRLIRGAEETGRQHILWLMPDTNVCPEEDLHCSKIVDTLFKSPIEELFPAYHRSDEGYRWADFRCSPNTGGWTGKAYGLERHEKRTGFSEETLSDGRRVETREYSVKEVSTVLVVKWRPKIGVFEMRIDLSQCSNEQGLTDRREAMWHLLSPALKKEFFVGLNINTLMECLVDEYLSGNCKDGYEIGKIELTDPRSGLIRVIPVGSEAIDRDSGRRSSVEAMRKQNFIPSSIRIDWNLESDATTSQTLPFVLEKTEHGPEWRMLKKIPEEVYEDVFGKLQNRIESTN